jgi:hypothetical protein
MGLDRNKSGVGGSSRSGKGLTRWMAKDGHPLAPARVTKEHSSPFCHKERLWGGHQYAEFDTTLRPW